MNEQNYMDYDGDQLKFVRNGVVLGVLHITPGMIKFAGNADAAAIQFFECVVAQMIDADRLHAELAAAQRDAERYRWLRSNWNRACLDECIDAALAAKGDV